MIEQAREVSSPRPVRRIALALIGRQGAFGVVRRRSNDVLDGLWEFPGGGIRPSESPGDAAVREALEETGLRVIAQCVLPAARFVYPHGAVELHPVICRMATPQDAAGALRWVGLEELAALEMPAANGEIIRRLRAHLLETE